MARLDTEAEDWARYVARVPEYQEKIRSKNSICGIDTINAIYSQAYNHMREGYENLNSMMNQVKNASSSNGLESR